MNQGVDQTYILDASDRVRERCSGAADGTVEVGQITVPDHVDPGGPTRGYTIECPSCGQWSIIGTSREVVEDGGRISYRNGAWSCPNSKCDEAFDIEAGKISLA